MMLLLFIKRSHRQAVRTSSLDMTLLIFEQTIINKFVMDLGEKGNFESPCKHRRRTGGVDQSLAVEPHRGVFATISCDSPLHDV